MMRIWVVDTNLPGVTNQCIGIAKAISSQTPSYIRIVRTRIRTKRFRPLVLWAIRRKLIGCGRKNLTSRLLLNLFYSIGKYDSGEVPDVVITALSRSEYAAALFSGQAFVIHIGEPVYLPPSQFNFLVLVNAKAPPSGDVPHVRLPIYPTPVLRQYISALAAGRKRPECYDRWAVLIGGDGAGYSYRSRDWRLLGDELGRLAERYGAKLLLTTSRRTGAKAELEMSTALPAQVIEEAVWYAANPQPVVSDFMARCGVVFCTADSRSMISDSMTVGCPIYVISPQNVKVNAQHQRFLSVHESARRLRLVDLSNLAEIDIHADLHDWFQPLENCWSDDFLNALRQTRFPGVFSAGG